MITSIFSVYDSKTAAYLPPFFHPTKPSAIRALTDATNSTDHQFNKHAADYALFFLGTFDDLNCQFDLQKAPLLLCSLNELIEEI